MLRDYRSLPSSKDTHMMDKFQQNNYTHTFYFNGKSFETI